MSTFDDRWQAGLEEYLAKPISSDLPKLTAKVEQARKAGLRLNALAYRTDRALYDAVVLAWEVLQEAMDPENAEIWFSLKCRYLGWHVTERVDEHIAVIKIVFCQLPVERDYKDDEEPEYKISRAALSKYTSVIRYFHLSTSLTTDQARQRVVGQYKHKYDFGFGGDNPAVLSTLRKMIPNYALKPREELENHGVEKLARRYAAVVKSAHDLKWTPDLGPVA
jgi:hypothetical protein